MNKSLNVPTADFSQALQGKVAGVVMSSGDGQLGEGMEIVIRGASSVTQDNTPLYVIDGFPIEDFSSLNLNPEDIKSISILKDASAGAIMAAGYAELCSLVKDEKKASIYHEMAEDIVRALASEQYLARKGENFNFLLMHSTGSYLKGGEVDAPLTYADYYFMEAVFRLKNLK